MRNRRLRQNAVAEIEDKRPRREILQNRIDRAIQRCAAGEKHQRIEITLNRTTCLDAISRECKIDHPIKPNGIY